MNRLKELRQQQKKSQEDVAKEIGISTKTISRWENGETNIKNDKAQQLADYFNVPVGYLLGFTDWSDTFNDKENLELEDIEKLGFDKLILYSSFTNKEDFLKSLKKDSWASELFAPSLALAKSEEEKTAIIDTANYSFFNYLTKIMIALYYLQDYEAELLTRVTFLSQKDREQVLNIVKTFKPKNEE